MPLGNYVTLKEGVPERMHFIDDRKEARTIADSVTHQPKSVTAGLMLVDRLNGELLQVGGVPAPAQFSIIAEGLYAKIEPYLPGKTYKDFEFIVTQRGFGFMARYTVEVIPYKAS
jgi:UDP-N-acetylmuramoylalanine-D-glutamate ligase